MTVPPMAPFTRERVARTLLVSTAVGVFLSFVGAFDSSATPFVPRTALMVALAWIGTGIGMTSYRIVHQVAGLGDRRWVKALLSSLLTFAPMGLVVWLASRLVLPHRPALAALPGYVLSSLGVTLAMTFMAVALNRGGAQAAVAPPGPVKFLERLPPKLRGGEVWAVEAQDHYLRIHTSRGQDLILLRLADAVAELEGIEGARVHRSWWVARDAVADAQRGDGRAVLTLKDGSAVPVSRTYARLLRERGWI